jgi:predicted flap endonuclease-1-like 5' DNA nuclease
MVESVGEEQAERRAYDLTDIEGIGPAYAEKLATLGLQTTDDLLGACANLKGREDLAASTGISGVLILRWVNMADMFRIKGIGEEYSELLEAAGVDTVPELAQRRADNLTQKLAEVNEQKQHVRRLPTEVQVTGWIEVAKTLPRVVTY